MPFLPARSLHLNPFFSTIRSGSCPSQLLQAVNPERVDRVEREGGRDQVERSHDAKNRHSLGGSQRVRSNKHRPNILPAANLPLFARGSLSASSSQSTNGDHATVAPLAAAPSAAAAAHSTGAAVLSSAAASQRVDKEKRAKHPPSFVTDRYLVGCYTIDLAFPSSAGLNQMKGKFYLTRYWGQTKSSSVFLLL